MSRLHDEFIYKTHRGSSICYVLYESPTFKLYRGWFFYSFDYFLTKSHSRKPPQNRSKTSKLRPPVGGRQWSLSWSTGREAAPQIFPGVRTALRSVAGNCSVLLVCWRVVLRSETSPKTDQNRSKLKVRGCHQTSGWCDLRSTGRLPKCSTWFLRHLGVLQRCCSRSAAAARAFPASFPAQTSRKTDQNHTNNGIPQTFCKLLQTRLRDCSGVGTPSQICKPVIAVVRQQGVLQGVRARTRRGRSTAFVNRISTVEKYVRVFNAANIPNTRTREQILLLGQPASPNTRGQIPLPKHGVSRTGGCDGIS